MNAVFAARARLGSWAAVIRQARKRLGYVPRSFEEIPLDVLKEIVE